MPPRQPNAAILAAALALACSAPVAGQDAPRKVSRELADVLSGAQDDLREGKPAQALARLSGFRGPDHALRHLLLGHAHAQHGDRAAAVEEYRKALQLDPALSEAGIGLAQALAAEAKWPDAGEVLGRFVKTDSCEADVLLLYAQVAQGMRDGRLLGLLAGIGVRRFPSDGRFRRLDLAACLEREDYRAAGEAVRALLAATPSDARLWEQLASVSGRAGNEANALAALEACLLCDPNSLARHRHLLGALLAAGDWHTVVQRGQALLAGPMAKAAVADTALMDLLIRAADMGEQDTTVAAWLALVPEESHTQAMRIVAARRALRLGKPADARTALRLLIERDQADARVFLWAGHLAELAGDWAQAQSLYAHARQEAAPPGRLATLCLARLHLRRGQAGEAARLLRAYLDAHPEDSAARALLAVVEARIAVEQGPAEPRSAPPESGRGACLEWRKAGAGGLRPGG
jgi:predicted Zn-dependent protease